MLYFIPWVVFLLVVILAVPITAWLEKRKLQEAQGPVEQESDEVFEPTEEAEGEEAVATENADDGFGEAEPADAEMPEGGDDFSAFEEIK